LLSIENICKLQESGCPWQRRHDPIRCLKKAASKVFVEKDYWEWILEEICQEISDDF